MSYNLKIIVVNPGIHIHEATTAIAEGFPVNIWERMKPQLYFSEFRIRIDRCYNEALQVDTTEMAKWARREEGRVDRCYRADGERQKQEELFFYHEVRG